MTADKQFVPVVAVLNMKGGVGKTTISANVFRVLFQERKLATLLVDLDPQFNLTQALRSRLAYDKLKDEGKTVYAAMEPLPRADLFSIKTSDQPPPLATELAQTLFQIPRLEPRIKLDLIAGDFDLVKYSLMDDNKKLASVRKRFKDFVANARENYGVVVIDCNPSSSFLTMCGLSVCTHVLVPVRPDRYSVLGLEMLWRFVNVVAPINPKPEFVVLLNGLQRPVDGASMGTVEAELRGHDTFGKRTLSNTLRISGVLEAKPNFTGFAVDRGTSWTSVVWGEVAELAKELSQKLGIR